MVRAKSLAIAAFAMTVLVAIVSTQGRGGNSNEWPTAYGDAQHSSWIRSDANISVESMSRPGFGLQWKTKLASPARHGVALSQAVVTPGVTLFTPLSTLAGPANLIFALDNDTGNLFWTRRIEGSISAGTAACPGGISGAPTRIVNLVPPAATPGRGGAGRSGRAYSSAVGEPGAGVPIAGARGGATRGRAAGDAPPPPAPAQPAPAGRRQAAPPQPPQPSPQPSPFPTNPSAVAAAGGPGGGLFRSSGVIHVVSADGMFRTVGLVSGKDVQKPARFLPAGAQFSDLIGVGDMVYTSTSHACAGAPNGIWAIGTSGDPISVVSWKTNGGDPIGPIAFTTAGTLIAAIGPGRAGSGGYANAVVALDPKTLTLKDWFTQPGVEFAAAPVVFQESGKDVVAVTTKAGSLVLLDTASLGGADHHTPLFTSERLTARTSALSVHSAATWQDGTTRWLLVPTAHGVVALKAAPQASGWSVQAGWTSENITSPLTPIVVNGVAFIVTSADGAPAKLFALDATTGKTLWQSGSAMNSSVSGRSFWAGSGQVYVGTVDGTVYAFGFDMERGAPDKRSGS